MARVGARKISRRAAAAVSVAVAGALALTACGGAKVGGGGSSTASAGGGGTKACGTVNIADNAWVGYEADLAVVQYVLTTKLHCTVKVSHINEQVSWQGFGAGTIDVILENWGHEDLAAKYITNQKVAVDDGQTGLKGIIGWYVPPWMAVKYPDITNWQNLNKYASLFKTSESGGKGELLDGDPSYVTNDAALVKNLHLNFKVVQGGSEAALIQSFKSAQANKTPLLAYFYEPQWFFSEMKLVKVNLPAYTTGCDANAAKVACDYPPYNLNKVVSAKFANSGSPAATFIKNWTWTNDGQNEVAKLIAVNKLSDDAAAQQYLSANPQLVTQWLQGTGAS